MISVARRRGSIRPRPILGGSTTASTVVTIIPAPPPKPAFDSPIRNAPRHSTTKRSTPALPPPVRPPSRRSLRSSPVDRTRTETGLLTRKRERRENAKQKDVQHGDAETRRTSWL